MSLRKIKKASDAIRILHCPNMVGGNPCGLARAERELGLESWSVSFTQNPYGYKADEVLWSDRNGRIIREIKRWRLFLRALRDFDIVHFNFGQSIMPQWHPQNRQSCKNQLPLRCLLLELSDFYVRFFEQRDLAWLRRAGKGIVVTYQGDDARQGDFCLDHFPINPAREVEPGYYSPEVDAHKRQRIARFSQYADRIYALNPDLLHVLPPQAQFLPYSHIDLKDWHPVDDGKPVSEVPVVLHAPSHRGVKGTRFILDAISRLKAEGISLEFMLLEGVAHAKARSIYQQADLIVDQLLCGWYGGLAVEAMALGKPVISYIREDDLKFIPPQMRGEIPIINATPETIYGVLREWLTTRRNELQEVGRRSRAYVEAWHDPLKIAARLKEDYQAIMTAKKQKGV